MDDLIAGAGELMALGMGTVFVFLTALVFTTVAMSKIVRAVAPDPPVAKPRESTHRIDPRIRQAIQLAILEHRKQR